MHRVHSPCLWDLLDASENKLNAFSFKKEQTTRIGSEGSAQNSLNPFSADCGGGDTLTFVRERTRLRLRGAIVRLQVVS
jgi:hypothetical protein